jgi:hypothetical protein
VHPGQKKCAYNTQHLAVHINKRDGKAKVIVTSDPHAYAIHTLPQSSWSSIKHKDEQIYFSKFDTLVKKK